VILMDVQMPKMDGIGGEQGHLRALGGPGSGRTFIAMTANAMQGDREMCLEAGNGRLCQQNRSA